MLNVCCWTAGPFCLPLRSSSVRKRKRKFPSSPQWRKLMIIQAPRVWNLNSRSATLRRLCRWAEQASLSQSPLLFFSFSTDVCNYSADLSSGSEAAWSHDIPPPPTHPPAPTVSSETTAVVEPHSPRYTAGKPCSLLLLCIYLFSPPPPSSPFHYGRHSRPMADVEAQAAARGGNAMHLRSGNTPLPLPPMKNLRMWFPQIREEI